MDPLDLVLTDSLRPTAPPAGLADRIAAAAVSDFHFRRVRRRVLQSTAGIGTVILLSAVTWLAWPAARSNGHRELATRPVIDPFRETHQRLTDAAKVDMPTIHLPDSITFDMPHTSTDRFFSLPDRAKESVQPVTAPVTRAASRWAKEFGSAFAIPKPRM